MLQRAFTPKEAPRTRQSAPDSTAPGRHSQISGQPERSCNSNNQVGGIGITPGGGMGSTPDADWASGLCLQPIRNGPKPGGGSSCGENYLPNACRGYGLAVVLRPGQHQAPSASSPTTRTTRSCISRPPKSEPHRRMMHTSDSCRAGAEFQRDHRRGHAERTT